MDLVDGNCHWWLRSVCDDYDYWMANCVGAYLSYAFEEVFGTMIVSLPEDSSILPLGNTNRIMIPKTVKNRLNGLCWMFKTEQHW